MLKVAFSKQTSQVCFGSKWNENLITHFKNFVPQPTWMGSGGLSKDLCWCYLLSHLLGDGREHDSYYNDLMSLTLEQSREIQRIPQASFIKR